MKITIIASGSRGDVQPYIGMAKALHEANHEVRLLTHENFGSLVRGANVNFYELRGNVQEVAESPEIKEALASGNVLKVNSMASKYLEKATLDWGEDALVACEGVDLIMAGLGGLLLGLALAEKLNIPFMQAHLLPFTPTQAFPSILLASVVSSLGFFNGLSHHITQQAIWQSGRVADNKMREKVLGIKPLPFFGGFNAPRLTQLPILYGISPSVLPKPADWHNVHMTGYWFLDAETQWQPPTELVDFLNAGIKPLYIGFGSMSNRNPQETTDLVFEALHETKQRAVMVSGWGGFEKTNLPSNVYMLDSVPHDWLFPRVSATIHHGGAGTTAAGLRAGVPAILIPFFADQPFWGNRLAQLGVSPQPISRKKLNKDNLASAIREVTSNPAMSQKAAQLGQQIQAENGVCKVVDIINGLKL
jgi:sterol 3beta-glucosyltransferase